MCVVVGARGVRRAIVPDIYRVDAKQLLAKSASVDRPAADSN